jgi:hypothetical protein
MLRVGAQARPARDNAPCPENGTSHWSHWSHCPQPPFILCPFAGNPAVEKLIYLLHKAATEPLPADFTCRVIDALVPRLRAEGASDIVLNVTDLNEKVRREAPSRIFGDWDGLAGALHFWVDSVDQRFAIEPLMREFAPAISGYLVTESVVQKTPRTWKDGERRPGVTQLAVICKAPAVSEDAFYHNWQQVHSVQSFELHPSRVSYVRNAVARVLTPGARDYRIIVLEHWRELRDFTDDSRYFGSPEAVQEMYRDLPGFADSSTTTTGPVSEYAFD